MNARLGQPPGRGVYGFRICGVSGVDDLLVEAPAHWRRLELVLDVTSARPPTRERVDDRMAILLPRSGGWVSIDRRAGAATLSLPTRPAPGALIHPHLASVAVVSAHWLGRETFHAGAFVAGGKAWGVLGGKEAGKSSFLAGLAEAGMPIVSDDVLVLDEFKVLAGPRAIDLRPDAAQRIGGSEAMGRIGLRERWRMGLDSVLPELPLGGWVRLNWDEACAVRPLRGSDRLRALGAHRASSLRPPKPDALIELSSLPMLELQRPRRWELADEAMNRLLDAVGGSEPHGL